MSDIGPQYSSLQNLRECVISTMSPALHYFLRVETELPRNYLGDQMIIYHLDQQFKQQQKALPPNPNNTNVWCYLRAAVSGRVTRQADGNYVMTCV